jgi:hypothetical protein
MVLYSRILSQAQLLHFDRYVRHGRILGAGLLFSLV